MNIVTIAAASCANMQQVNPQPVWSEIRAERPDVLRLLGDNIYLDHDRHSSPDKLRREIHAYTPRNWPNLTGWPCSQIYRHAARHCSPLTTPAFIAVQPPSRNMIERRFSVRHNGRGWSRRSRLRSPTFWWSDPARPSIVLGTKAGNSIRVGLSRCVGCYSSDVALRASFNTGLLRCARNDAAALRRASDAEEAPCSVGDKCLIFCPFSRGA